MIKTTPKATKYMTLKEAAVYLRLSQIKMYQLVARNKIKHFKPEGKIYFIHEDLDAYVTESADKKSN